MSRPRWRSPTPSCWDEPPTRSGPTSGPTSRPATRWPGTQLNSEAGRGLFQDGDDRSFPELVDSKAYPPGVLNLTYQPSNEEPVRALESADVTHLRYGFSGSPSAESGRRLASIAPRSANQHPPASINSSEQELRLQALIDSSPLALVEFALDTSIRLWNPAAERIFGWTREEMLGRAGLPMAPPHLRAEAEDLFRRVAAGESVNDLETVRRHKDGPLVPVSIAAAPVRDGSGRVVGNMVAYTDITERKTQAAEVHRLNAELQVRLEELAASRARIVAAGDIERRRLERNLHDGAQQRLVALALSLRIALAKLESDPEAARATLGVASEELARALDELRELARGLHPAVLTDRGLPAAVEMLAGRAPVPVEIAEVPDERLPEAVEAAAYYLIAEALTNVAKYASASTVRVRIAARDGHLLVEIADDGVGGADPLSGSGLRGLADRVEALGGTLKVVSPAGAGTTLRAEVPLAPDV